MADITEAVSTDRIIWEDAPSVEPGVDAASQPFVGRWNGLISTTNWEKGRIIVEWREALIAAGAPATQSADEAWARRVGAVTPQHVGRLRRVHQRFAGSYGEYRGLYWSHFYAALDWDDAELWLEGAVQSRWSVSQMRRQRWQAMGAVADLEPRDADIVVADPDEDVPPLEPVSGSLVDVEGPPVPEGPDFGDEDDRSGRDDGAHIFSGDDPERTVDFVRPFENLAELPADLAEAFEAFKLALLRHKAEGWQQISREDVLASLDALKELVLAPSVE